jgi:hypothetical protein
MREKTMQDWAKDAMMVQDACNLSGVVHSFSEFMRFLSAQNLGTDAKNSHPISVLFASKIASLTQCDSVISQAWDACQKLTGDHNNGS